MDPTPPYVYPTPGNGMDDPATLVRYVTYGLLFIAGFYEVLAIYAAVRGERRPEYIVAITTVFLSLLCFAVAFEVLMRRRRRRRGGNQPGSQQPTASMQIGDQKDPPSYSQFSPPSYEEALKC